MTDDWKERVAKRAEVIRRLRKDEGLTLEKLAALSTEDRIVCNFWNATPEEMFDRIRIAAYYMPDDQYARAIRNALAIGMGMSEANLTERRMRMLEYMDVSLRTLINYEDVGAEALARSLGITATNIYKDAKAMDLEAVAVQLIRLQEVVDRSGIDDDLPLKISDIKSEISRLGHRIDAIENNINTLWAAVFPKSPDSGVFNGLRLDNDLTNGDGLSDFGSNS